MSGTGSAALQDVDSEDEEGFKEQSTGADVGPKRRVTSLTYGLRYLNHRQKLDSRSHITGSVRHEEPRTSPNRCL